ncbi:MAG: MotA/TolQ/ExbB proton channel family protein [Sulfurovaceae bacterium]|nr:MotA/TolQ/ExbB proton channel family protein [Sulfurovaceae bacterium]
MNNLLETLNNPINKTIVIVILILAIIDLFFKKDLKSQIVSLGVLGTFIGIFMGLQDFNPNDMKNSINTILIGLKTAFFTSIAGMGVALFLSILQKISNKDIDDSENHGRVLAEISNKLNNLEKLDNSNNTDKIIGELERLRTIITDNRDESKKIATVLNELKENSSKENQALISILNLNFNKMNHSLEIAIEKLSKGATEEIINALKRVIEEFNQELQTQFGENFVKLNESVINLVQWQNNYKSHIQELENHLKLSTFSIEKSKDSLETISSKNQDILKVYQELKHIIDIYDRQINELNSHLQTYANLSSSAKEMFSSITHNISNTKSEFTNLTEHIKKENRKQIESSKETNKYIINNFQRNQKELELISNHFKNLGEQIPKALQISLENLNRGLTSLTTQFQKDYKEIMDRYRRDIQL